MRGMRTVGVRTSLPMMPKTVRWGAWFLRKMGSGCEYSGSQRQLISPATRLPITSGFEGHSVTTPTNSWPKVYWKPGTYPRRISRSCQ